MANNDAWYNHPSGLGTNMLTTSSATTMPTYYATNTQLQVTPQLILDGRYWLFDPQRAMYYLSSDNKVRLTQEQVEQIQRGAAVLDWQDMHIRYLDKNTGESSGYYTDSIVSRQRMHVFPDYPNLDKLDMLVEQVCQRGRLAA